MADSIPTWETDLPVDLGALPLGGRLTRTDPAGACPAAIALIGLYPAHIKTAQHTLHDGTRIQLPVQVERRSFDGSRSGKELANRYLKPLGLSRDQVFLIDLYPYFLANTAKSTSSGRSMWDNVKRYHEETGTFVAIKGRPDEDTMLVRCRTAANLDRLAYWFKRCRPRLVITLGNEVAAFVRGYNTAKTAQKHLYGEPFQSHVFTVPVRVVHVAHPGVFVRRVQANPWLDRHDAWCAGPGAVLIAEALHGWPGRREDP